MFAGGLYQSSPSEISSIRAREVGPLYKSSSQLGGVNFNGDNHASTYKTLEVTISESRYVFIKLMGKLSNQELYLRGKLDLG